MSATLQEALKTERPLQVVGVINAYCALLAERAGFRAFHASESGYEFSFLRPDAGPVTRAAAQSAE